ncbi:MAG: response regulator [Phascolarctobacterium sp.]
MQKVRVGYFYLPGYHEIDEQGRMQGYGYDLVQRLKFYNNWQCEYVGYEYKWLEGLQALERGEVDLVTGVRLRPNRLDKFAYSSNPVGRSAAALLVRDDETRFVSGNYHTYQGMRIGAVKDSIINMNFPSFAKSKGFTYEMHYYDTMVEQMRALRESKEVDAVLTSSMRFMKKERMLDQYDSEYVYAVVKKGNEELLGQVNKAIYKMDYVNPMWRQDLFTKYFTPRKGQIFTMSHDELAYRDSTNVAERKFKVLVNPDRRPYSYLEEGQFKGIFPQLMQEMARRSGLKYRYLPVQNRQEYLRAIQEKQADIILDMPDNDFQAEALGYNLSEPLFHTTLFVVKLRGNKEQPKQVAFVRSAYGPRQKPDFLPEGAQVHYLDSFEDCLTGVKNGKYDATYMYAFQAQDVVARDGSQSLMMAIVPSVQLSYCMGIKASESYQLASILNKALVSVKSNYMEQLMAGYAAEQAKPPLWEEIIHDPWGVGTIIFVAMSIISLLVMLRMREKNVELVSKKNEQLQEQQELLSRALEQAEASSKAKTVFLNSVSHDIRTPMNAIMGFAKLAEEQAINPTTKRYLDKILLSGKSLLSLINDVLDMSSIENGKLKVHEEYCDLAELLKNIHEMLQPAAKEKQLQFLLDASRIGAGQVLCDRVLLQRILLNCLSNSIKYTDVGGIVSLRAEQKGPAVDGHALFSFRVSDNGIGMSKEFMERLFEPFARERDTTTSGIQGTGLGMTITKNIVELLGGKIDVQSEVGQGTVVYVDLSLQLAPEAHKAAEAAEEQLELKGKHVLLVDDVELNREIAQMMLEKAGFEVTCCVNGQQAVDYMAQAKDKQVDLVLMDLMMPVMDGIEAAKLIRRLPDGAVAKTTIIALTANAMNETKQEVLEAGMDGMLNKPFDVQALKRVLQEVWRRK